VKKTPKISDLVKDPEPVKENVVDIPADVQVAEPGTPSETEIRERVSEVALEPNNASDMLSEVSDSSGPVSEEKLASEGESSENGNELAVDEKFKEVWGTMFELLFREIATIYYPLKGWTPTIKHNIILVKVKNEMMKENFESRVRLALEYLRNNYDPRIDDIHVEVDANTEPVAKVIYDTQDKLNDLRSENPDLPEFLKILNLSAKDM
jgi:hypothetical protein